MILHCIHCTCLLTVVSLTALFCCRWCGQEVASWGAPRRLRSASVSTWHILQWKHLARRWVSLRAGRAGVRQECHFSAGCRGTRDPVQTVSLYSHLQVFIWYTHTGQFHSSCLFLLLGDIAENDSAYRYRCYCSMVYLSVTFVHCAQTAEDIDTISFAYDSSMSPQIALKFGLDQINPVILLWNGVLSDHFGHAQT